jgi:hypothetical protein
MGWKEYYQTCPESYYCRLGRGLFKRVLEESSCSPLAKKESLRLVLGGFSPQSPTAAAFVRDCFCFRPQKKDEIYLLDFNRQPFKEISLPSLSQEKKLFFLQADLTKMPFADESLDLIWLDGTISFMNNQNLTDFGRETRRVLTREGIAISFSHEPLICLFPSSGVSRSCWVNKTQVYSRSVQENLSLLKDLKLIWHLDGDRETALVFAKNNSPYSPFSGLPFALEAVNKNF